jgi:uncharacterized membrane protein
MAERHARKIPNQVRIFLACVWGTFCLAIIGVPLLHAWGYDRAASVFSAVFSTVCHQNASRSFVILGYPLAVCHRCSGIYFGILLVALLPCELRFVRDSLSARRLWAACATLPLLLDALLSFAGLWPGTAVTRSGTGLLFGAMLSSFVAPALAEIADEALRGKHNLGVAVLGDST